MKSIGAHRGYRSVDGQAKREIRQIIRGRTFFDQQKKELIALDTCLASIVGLGFRVDLDVDRGEVLTDPRGEGSLP